MNSRSIIDSLCRISGGHGYVFGTGPIARALDTGGGDAGLWLLPPALSMVDGRSHGRASYDLSLHMTRRLSRATPEQTVSAAATTEEEALSMLSELSEEPYVALVDSVKIEVRQGGLRPDASVHILVTAKVETIF